MAILGNGSGTGFPTTIDTAQTYQNVASPDADSATRVDAELLNDILDAILAIENNVGRLATANAWTQGQVIMDGLYTKWTSADTDIDGLIDGSQFGTLLAGFSSGHVTIALRDNDAADSFSIISGGGNYNTDTTYDTLIFRALADGKVGVGMKPTVQFELSGSVGQKASGTTWSNPSDARLKNNVTDYLDGLEVVRKIRPVRYELNGLAGTPKGQCDIGVIGQEMLEVMPYTIERYKAKLYTEDLEETELYRFNASAVTFALINAVKELDARLSALER